mmetsp:Transcript_23926/g.59633  ORF Transcript_23926/g.59633 Transcript_23926/m.59633 type:complete len:299 (+) Transcript_23926:64-960(+)
MSSFETPTRKRKTCDEMRESLRKMGRKVSGTKAELEERLDKVLNTNDRGWLKKCKAKAGEWHYLASGAHRDVYKGVYLKGPRKDQPCVKKVFKTGSVYENTFFQEDIKAIAEVAKIIQAFNITASAKKVYINEPEVWEDVVPDAFGKKVKWLCEPFIKGTYRKFNSNTAFADESYHTMQALSHFSFHHSGGRRVVCDLQGGYYEDFYVLTDPVVCSTEKAFGATDLGTAGIQNFFAHHRCNHLCKPHWSKPAVVAKHFQPVPGTSFLPRAAPTAAAANPMQDPTVALFEQFMAMWMRR